MRLKSGNSGGLLWLLLALCGVASAFVGPTMVNSGGAEGGEKIAICGAGVIGCSIAFHLAKKGLAENLILIDRVGVAPAASGKAGGFLAKDWNDGTVVGPLARKSFELHEKIAEELGLESYRRLRCEAIAVEEGAAEKKPSNKKLESVEWADIGAKSSRSMGDESTIAQVHPKELTEGMFKYAVERGAKLHKGVVEEILSENNKVTGVLVSGETVQASKVVVAMGPWSSTIKGLTLPPMFGQKYHSVLMQAESELSQAVFFQGKGDPEVYPRPKGEVYLTGFPDRPIPVKELPGEEEVRQDVCDRLESTIRSVSNILQSAPVTKSQSCYLPLCIDGAPLIGALSSMPGAYVATGHGCWGTSP